MSYLKNYSRSAEVVFCHAEVKRVLPQSRNQISELIIKIDRREQLFFFLSKIFGGPGILNLAKEILSVIDVYEINHIRHLISNPSTKRLNLICVSDHKRLEIFGNVNNRAVTTKFRACQMKPFYSYQRHSL